MVDEALLPSCAGLRASAPGLLAEEEANMAEPTSSTEKSNGESHSLLEEAKEAKEPSVGRAHAHSLEASHPLELS